MKVYELLKENGFIVESPNGQDKFLTCNENRIFFLDFLNDKGFKIQYSPNQFNIIDEFEYEYGNDFYAGRVKIILKKDFTEQIHFKFECKKPEK